MVPGRAQPAARDLEAEARQWLDRRGLAARIRSIPSARSLAGVVNDENPGLFVYAPDGDAWGEAPVGKLVEEIAAPMLLIRAPAAP